MGNIIRKLKGRSFKEIFFKIINKIQELIGWIFNKWYDENHSTFGTANRSMKINRILEREFKINYNDNYSKDVINNLHSLYMNHYFDILGSGWVNVKYGMEACGVEGIKFDSKINIREIKYDEIWFKELLRDSHLDDSIKVWNVLVDGIKEFNVLKDKNFIYDPIDWQLDFKSGYRFDEKNWYRNQKIESGKGYDIKVPWELSRMQHLPQLAMFVKMQGDINKTNESILEIRSQILDFILMNPPRMGVNWACTMDVGIRVANMVFAYDLINTVDSENILDKEFKKIFSQSVYDHGKHIINNLEKSDNFNGNHYLADIAGLLFVSAYLESNRITDKWLIFSIKELIKCVKEQFNEDGSNFEASTAYHRLSGEIVVYSFALISGVLKTDRKEKILKRITNKELKKSRTYFDFDTGRLIDENLIRKLYRIGQFIVDITKENGEICQVGDNDNGRFFKLSPCGNLLKKEQAIEKYINLSKYKTSKQWYWDENILNCETMISSYAGLFNRIEFEDAKRKFPIEYNIVKMLSKNTKYDVGSKDIRKNFTKKFDHNEPLKYRKETIIKFNDAIDLKDIQFIEYPDFGIYLFRSNMFYLSICASDNGQNGTAGHTHNDKLSFELNICGNDLVLDPGTYLYTPSSDRRNQFRSVNIHNTISVEGQEQNYIDKDKLFSMKNDTRCNLIDKGHNHIKLSCRYRDVLHTRKFIINEKELIIIDCCNKAFKVNEFSNLISNGYGKIYQFKGF